MAYEFYVTIEGKTQGAFKGESIREAHKDKIAGISFNYELVSPRDVATGQASGKRQHKPITITKEWGPATPMIFTALCTNESLPTVLFEFIHTTPDGVEEVHHKITLTNATISSVRQYITPTRHEQRSDIHELEEVSFTFQRIEIENVSGSTMGVDDWTQ